ncbi:D-alanyl-D-alanine carboxypeptidase [Kribbella voronezhensis]|uniref:D-alanyl-D-alanine carboxypeptidase n=1 Tax=Kribbella voronezhensis TaxID=2512212 RepID=A0A4R7TBA4_9ACTN|nr:serine hydrolase domain-containing protein [Kribbella voronezhensis]TDU89311.1 D-alanyl-D-alanine carboxypeptidase [Kribbella voronezhensis]
MPTLRRILAASTAVGTLAALAATTATTATASPTPATPAVDAVATASAQRSAGLQQALDAIVAAGAVGTLAEVRTDRGTWRGTSGVAELGSTTPVPARGLFRAGSITKTFLAAVVLQLVAEHELGLDDHLADLLPQSGGVVPGAERITVRQLLTHTSGLGDFMSDLPLRPPSAFLAVRWKTWDPWELVKLASAHPTTTPGQYHYSNAGYLLLGMVVERVTGHSYGSEIQHRVIDRLGLHRTTMPGTDPVIHGPHPHGYLPVEDNGMIRPVDLTELNPSVFGAAGELVSSTSDLNRFFAALLYGKVVRRDLLHLMTQPPEGSTYGAGLRKRTLTCAAPAGSNRPAAHVTAYGNDGDALAYLSYSFTTADRRRQVTVSLTPWGPDRNSTDSAVDALIERALCP